MNNVQELYERLEHYKSINPDTEDPDDPYGEHGRHNYCHLVYYLAKDKILHGQHKAGWHKFEVRSWKVTSDFRMIELQCVNWTVCAGTCSVSIKDDTLHLWKIWEDEPTIQVLYG